MCGAMGWAGCSTALWLPLPSRGEGKGERSKVHITQDYVPLLGSGFICILNLQKGWMGTYFVLSAIVINPAAFCVQSNSYHNYHCICFRWETTLFAVWLLEIIVQYQTPPAILQQQEINPSGTSALTGLLFCGIGILWFIDLQPLTLPLELAK